jgi:hypothetical protein
MNPRASSGLKKRCKHRGTEFTSSAQPIKPSLRVRRPRVAEASAEAQALREGGLKGFPEKKNWHLLISLIKIGKNYHILDYLRPVCNFIKVIHEKFFDLNCLSI